MRLVILILLCAYKCRYRVFNCSLDFYTGSRIFPYIGKPVIIQMNAYSRKKNKKPIKFSEPPTQCHVIHAIKKNILETMTLGLDDAFVYGTLK